MASKGDANKYTLADRMKDYEAVTTSAVLMPGLPVYVRIDQRAGHTWTRGLQKPFDPEYTFAIQETTKYLVEKTGAVVGYCQSDEISLVYLDPSKLPFETRLFKIESVFASMATAAFIAACLKTERLKDKALKSLPSFDCRACSMPTLAEAANMILWRELDCLKNSVTMAALDEFSDKQIHKKNTDDKIQMLKNLKGIVYEEKYPEHLRYGSYFRRELYLKPLSDEDKARIPADQLSKIAVNDESGQLCVTRSRISQFTIGMPLKIVENREEVLFSNGKARRKP